MTFGPALRATAGIAVLSGMDAVIKGMAAHYPVLQVAFLRFVFGTLVAAGVVAVLRPGWPSRETTIANGLRSVIAVLTATAFFYALSELPLAETLVLSFLAPMFVALFGLVLLREPVGGRVAAALASAVLYAFSLVLLRQRALRDRYAHIVIFQNVGPMLLISPFGLAAWQTPSLPHFGWFLAIGALGVLGHILMATAFAKAAAARLASLEYTALIWAALIGYAVFDEVPTLATLVGGALIVGAALITSRR